MISLRRAWLLRSIAARVAVIAAPAVLLLVPGGAWAGGGGGGGGVQAVTVDAPGLSWGMSTALLRSVATLLAAGLILARARAAAADPGLRRAAWLLVVVALPFELVAGVGADRLVQVVCAVSAWPLLVMTGLSPDLGIAPPTILLPQVTVHITRECASSSGLAAWLAVVVLVVHLLPGAASSRRRWVVTAFGIGVATNVVRIVVSTHAAVRLVPDAQAWDLAHDLIGYGVYGLCYAALVVWLVRQLRRARTASLVWESAALTAGR